MFLKFSLSSKYIFLSISLKEGEFSSILFKLVFTSDGIRVAIRSVGLNELVKTAF